MTRVAAGEAVTVLPARGARASIRVGERAHLRVNRIHQLDAIRGLLAIGVMLYHVADWPTVFGTWGVYFFFTLSGWALEHVYGQRLVVREFAVARVARVAPLWIPVVLVSTWLAGIADPARILINLTGAFGFLLPGQTSIVTGGWSIGIEVSLYVLFPVLTRLSVRGLAALTIAGVIVRLGWTAAYPITDWVAYTQLPSFLVFFTAGMLGARTVRLPEWRGRLATVATVLGDLSYGTYLLHPIVASLVGVPALVLTPLLSLAIRRLYEIPVGRWLRGLRLRPLGTPGSRGRHPSRTPRASRP